MAIQGKTWRERIGIAGLTTLLLGIALTFGMPGASAAELSAMSAADIRALQQRLTDAKCYTGPIDGAASAETKAALKATVAAFENVILHLAFSRDGRSLAAVLSQGKGLRVIDVERLTEIAADRDYGGKTNRTAFAPDGRLFTVAYDGQLRAYDRSF